MKRDLDGKIIFIRHNVDEEAKEEENNKVTDLKKETKGKKKVANGKKFINDNDDI